MVESGRETNSIPLPVEVETRSLEPVLTWIWPERRETAPTQRAPWYRCSMREPRGYSHDGWFGQ